jgi:uncharacterized protein (TIGR02598 family)
VIKRFRYRTGFAFSLVEVVLALGVVAFAIVAILGIIPTGLSTSHSAQDDTRSAQIAQDFINSMASQAQTNFAAVKLTIPGNANPPTLDLTSSSTSPAAQLYANNDGKLSDTATNATYSVQVSTNNAPIGFDSGYANQITVRIAWPATAAPSAQTVRDYVRIVSKY